MNTLALSKIQDMKRVIMLDWCCVVVIWQWHLCEGQKGVWYLL